MRYALAVVIALALAMSGCDRGGAPTQPTPCQVQVDQDPILTIGADAREAGPVSLSRLTRSAGLYYVAETYSRGEVAVFDARGRYVRTIGTYGAGPGENRAAEQVAARGDTVFIYDGEGLRINRYLSSGEFLGGIILYQGRTPFAPRTGGGVLMLRRPSPTAGQVVAEVRNDSTTVYSVAVSNESTRLGEATLLRDVDGRAFWIASRWRYLFELYSYDGRRLARVAGNPEWFPPFAEYRQNRERYEMYAGVQDIMSVPSGRLLVLIVRYPKAPLPSASAGSEVTASSSPGEVRGDNVIHVLDPDGDLVADYTAPRAIQRLDGFADAQHLYARDELPNGIPVLRVYRFSLTQNPNSQEVCS